jgi:quercetin dioxygenase-like cupin family protein
MKPLSLIRLSTLALALAALGPTAAWAEDPSHADHIMVLPADLKWEDSKVTPGAKVAVIEGPPNEAVPFTFRVKLPADFKVPAHWHPALEHVTVLSGTYNFGTGDKFDKEKTKALPPGSTVINQPKTNHFIWTSEETVIQVHGVGPRISISWTQRTIRGRSSLADTRGPVFASSLIKMSCELVGLAGFEWREQFRERLLCLLQLLDNCRP